MQRGPALQPGRHGTPHKPARPHVLQGGIILEGIPSIRYFAYYIIFGINTGSIMPPPWAKLPR